MHTHTHTNPRAHVRNRTRAPTQTHTHGSLISISNNLFRGQNEHSHNGDDASFFALQPQNINDELAGAAAPPTLAESVTMGQPGGLRGNRGVLGAPPACGNSICNSLKRDDSCFH